MEKEGQAINAIGKLLRFFLRTGLYLIWGASRMLEVLLSELNKLLKHALEGKR